MHQSFVNTASPPTGMDGGIAGIIVWGSNLSSSLAVPGEGLVILRKYTPVQFTITKSRAMTLCRSSQCRASSRAMMDEKSSLLFPVGGEAVVTNGWCTI